MAQLIVWNLWLIILLVACIRLFPKVLLTPQFLFFVGFIPQALFLFFFVKKWDVDFGVETMVLLVGGTGLFLVANIVFYYLFAHTSGTKCRPHTRTRQQRDDFIVERWKLVAFLIFQILALVNLIRYYMLNIPGATLQGQISYINAMNKFGDVEDAILLPKYINWPRMISVASCYIIGYILVQSIVLRQKQHRTLLVCNLLLGLIGTMLTGGRMEGVGVCVIMAIDAYFINGKSKQWSRSIRMKTVVRVLLLSIAILVVFQPLLALIGRSSKISTVDYLGMYISAPLKNLDTIVREGYQGYGITHNATFRGIINKVGRVLHISSLIYNHDYVTRYINGYHLGNVATVFFPYFHDGGYLGTMILLVVQAFVAQFVYRKAINSELHDGVSIAVVLYSYMAWAIFLSFFSERFFASLVTTRMVGNIICWYLLKLFFTKAHVRSAIREKVRKPIGQETKLYQY